MINLIFDYDGTLHESIKIYGPAFKEAYDHLVSLGLGEKRHWEEKEISHWLGFSSKDMWNSFMPDLPQKYKEECGQIIGEKMLELIKEGRAQLYPQAIHLLEELKKLSFNLIFLSNCKRAYMEAHIKHFNLDKYFSDFYCTEDFDFQPKYIIFESIRKNHPGDFIVIGDRYQDMEIAEKHNLKAIGCLYGYGQPQELSYTNMLAKEVKDILNYLKI